MRLTRGVDIRTVGSGNIGATNVWRSFGPRYAIPVIVLDVAKGFVPALVATLVAGHVAGALAGGAAMLGHWRPIFLGFAKGGKMVATCGGALFGLAPLVGLVGAGVWILVFVADALRVRLVDRRSALAAGRGAAPRRAVARARLLECGGAGSAPFAPSRQPLAAARRDRDPGSAQAETGPRLEHSASHSRSSVWCSSGPPSSSSRRSSPTVP